MQNDPLNSVLREWEAPEPPSALDAHIRAAYRAQYPPSTWRNFWRARVSVPVPALAALLLVAFALWLQFRPRHSPPLPASDGYLTRIERAGFKPLTSGAVRIIRAQETKQ